MTTRLRPRLLRTLTPGRWREYRALLAAALDHGYRVVALEDWVGDQPSDELQLVLRHDVDQHPASALTMAAVERDLGVEGAWYVRWRTANPAVVAQLRAAGGGVGLHYETLSRMALARGAREPGEISKLVPEARELLRREIAAFAHRHGPIRSVCAHGDSRIPLARNAALLEGQDPAGYGVEFDANDAMRGRGLAHWLTDRSRPMGRWAERVDPLELFAARLSPVLCVVHPNNWVSGASLWADRVLARALPTPGNGRARRPLRTGADEPRL